MDELRPGNERTCGLMPYRDPEKRRQAQRESARRRRAAHGATPAGQPRPAALPLPARVHTAEDILRLLSEAVAEVRAEDRAGALDRARVVGYLRGIALRAVEGAELEARLTARKRWADPGEAPGAHVSATTWGAL